MWVGFDFHLTLSSSGKTLELRCLSERLGHSVALRKAQTYLMKQSFPTVVVFCYSAICTESDITGLLL